MLSSERFYLSMPAGGASQGDIWVHLPHYDELCADAASLIITPRCDFAHDKMSVVNYVPLISLTEYLERIGYSRILGEELAEVESGIRNIDVGEPFSDLLRIGVPYGDVIKEMHRHAGGNSQGRQKSLSRLKEQVDKARRICEALTQRTITRSKASELVRPKTIRKHQEKVVRNQIADLHFLAPYPSFFSEPRIALLRYITTCDLFLLNSAQNSPNEVEWRHRCENNPAASPMISLCKQKPERLLRLRSPYMESFMARIAALFLRVGVPDFSRSELASYIGE